MFKCIVYSACRRKCKAVILKSVGIVSKGFDETKEKVKVPFALGL